MNNEFLLPAIEIDPGVPVRGSIIWLHGLGADGHDFEPIASQLELPPGLGFRFLLPHAPRRAVTINNGMVMPAWYDIHALDLSQGEDADGIHESAAQIMSLVQREQQRGVPHQRIVLAGFSQGGAVALHAGLRSEVQLGGIMALSAYLPLADHLEGEALPVNTDIPIYMAHGTDDTVVPFTLAELSMRQLRALGCQPRFHSYAMGHGVCLEEIKDIRAWLIQVFS